MCTTCIVDWFELMHVIFGTKVVSSKYGCVVTVLCAGIVHVTHTYKRSSISIIILQRFMCILPFCDACAYIDVTCIAVDHQRKKPFRDLWNHKISSSLKVSSYPSITYTSSTTRGVPSYPIQAMQ